MSQRVWFRRFSDPFGPLRAGKVDLQTCWLPVREPDLTVGPVVIADTRMLMVAAAHPLATRGSVSLEDLADCVMPQVTPSVPTYWETALIPRHTPSGRPIPRGPKVATFQEAQAVVVANQAACVVFAEANRYYQRPGTVYVPIRDAPLGHWALIWHSANDNPLVQAFAETAAAVRSDRAPTAGGSGME